ncbi:MAG: aspartate/glutamate racemase family protein [Micropepsaceae bacterium]
MAIGVFDSGVGGLTVHRTLVERMPAADFVYLADQANAPYGVRPGDEIVALTKAGCETLFDAGANLIVLACNTASAIALRTLQQTWLPGYRERLGRPVNILGIIVPTIEAATGVPWSQQHAAAVPPAARQETVGIFSTPATTASEVYEIEMGKRRPDLGVFSEPCPSLARLIESAAGVVELATVVENHVMSLRSRIGRDPDRAILGCTHYEIVADMFRAALPPGTPLIHQPAATADAIAAYLEKHPEYPAGAGGTRRFLTTGTPGPQSRLVEAFWGAPLSFEAA